LDRDRLVVEADDASVGERDTEDVAGEVVEHGLFAVATVADVKDPVFAPDLVRDDEIRAFAPQQRPELAAHQPRALTGTRNFRRAGCQVAPSSEIPPPLTRQ
jgi:hypothetical protein